MAYQALVATDEEAYAIWEVEGFPGLRRVDKWNELAQKLADMDSRGYEYDISHSPV